MNHNRILLLLVLIITFALVGSGSAWGQQSRRELNPVNDIDITGSPFKGPQDAPIVIVGFMDFQ